MITKKIKEIHQRLNDVKGSERKIVIFESSALKQTSDKKNNETFSLNSYYVLNWVYDQTFITSKFDKELIIDKFKMLMFGMPPKELKEIENNWRNILINSISKKQYVYFAYYIGGNNDIVVAEVGKLSEKEYNDQIKFSVN